MSLAPLFSVCLLINKKTLVYRLLSSNYVAVSLNYVHKLINSLLGGISYMSRAWIIRTPDMAVTANGVAELAICIKYIKLVMLLYPDDIFQFPSEPAPYHSV